jgi:hypothetical protein
MLLDADPKGAGRGSRSSHPGLLLEVRSPDADARRIRFEGSYNLLGSKVLENPLLGYKRVRGGFEGAWMVRRSR